MDDMNTKRNNSGFTLIEVLTIMLVVAVLASVGLPGMTRMLEGNRLSANTNRLVSSLYAARSEAVKQNIDVVICTRNDAGTACDAGKDWEDGWIVLVDGDVVNIVEKLSMDFGFDDDPPFPKELTFSGDGMVDSKVDFKLESEHDERMICLGSAGSVRTYDDDECP
jgi:type IV fimbrial biogenesis protein FimT